MKIIVTTSDRYINHICPIFCHLFNTFWSNQQQVEIVGYSKPQFELPPNFTFHSLGEQVGSNKNFSNDLIPYFDSQDRKFIWLFEDMFIKEPVKFDKLDICKQVSVHAQVGRVALSADSAKQYRILHDTYRGESIYILPPASEYRLSTQPAIWKKDFLLQYLTKDLNPWEFECQQKVLDDWIVASLHRDNAPVVHNEGVRRQDLFKFDLNGVPETVLQEMKQLKYI